MFYFATVVLQEKRSLKQRPGAGRQNITVLEVSSAAGTTLDPLVTFKGKDMQSTWFGDEALPNIFYGKSENGKNTAINELNTLILSLSF